MKVTFAYTFLLVLFAGSSKVIADPGTAAVHSLTCTGSSQESGACADAATHGTDWVDGYLSRSDVADTWRQWEAQVMRSHLDAMQARN